MWNLLKCICWDLIKEMNFYIGKGKIKGYIKIRVIYDVF